MKLKLYLVLLTSPFISFASHYLGGELTWKHISGSTYEFTAVLYRECRSATGNTSAGMPLSIALSSNSGATPSLSLINFSDVSPKCNSSSFPTGTALNCNNGAANQGRVERHVYRNSNVTLTGTPPATGWWFWFEGCDRPYSLTNLVNSIGGSQQFYCYTIRAAMFPYTINGVVQNVNTGYDDSPQFIEPPISVLSPGYVYNYAHYAGDSDLDSIS